MRRSPSRQCRERDNRHRSRRGRSSQVGAAVAVSHRSEGLTAKDEGALLAEQPGHAFTSEDREPPFAELDELRNLVAEGKERGFLTYEEIAACLEEVDVTKEQVQSLHGHLVENGIDVVSSDGKPAVSELGKVEAAAAGQK